MSLQSSTFAALMEKSMSADGWVEVLHRTAVLLLLKAGFDREDRTCPHSFDPLGSTALNRLERKQRATSFWKEVAGGSIPPFHTKRRSASSVDFYGCSIKNNNVQWAPATGRTFGIRQLLTISVFFDCD
ncbi:hypothetical protein AMECASPLE_033786 [Ameca splendens]|uniref:Uncharacterized protein n=1 Tax=Ameca splendens TaxID=208324 RepID=A0ABV0YTZ1_9TELE